MKNPDRETVSELAELPNIGKAMERTLRLAGIEHPKQLMGKEPLELYETLCKRAQKRYDPCVLDVFISVVRFMDGGEAQPWWAFTKERKEMLR